MGPTPSLFTRLMLITFELQDSGTLMTDKFDYTSPFGPLGMLADVMFLQSYMERLLLRRNEYIKNNAEQ
jgi:ligand-binding SRPBCC domain-containing protein